MDPNSQPQPNEAPQNEEPVHSSEPTVIGPSQPPQPPVQDDSVQQPQPGVSPQPSMQPSVAPVAPVIGDATSPATAPVAPVYATKKSRFPKKKLAVLLVVAFLLLGSATALAYKFVYVPNTPNNTVKTAVANAFKSETLNGVAVSLNYKDNSDTSSIPSTTIELVAGLKQNIARADFKAEVSAFKLSGSVIVDTKSTTAYAKINELSSLSSFLGGDLSSVIGDKWIKLTPQELTDTVAPQDNSLTSDKCLKALGSVVGSNDFKNQLNSLYTANSFASAKKAGSETVDSVATTKYAITVDQAKLQSFANATMTYTKDGIKKIDASCVQDGSTNPVDISGKTTIKDVTVWVAKDKQLKKVQFTVADSTSTVTVAVIFGQETKLDFTIPTNTIDSKTLFSNLFGSESISL